MSQATAGNIINHESPKIQSPDEEIAALALDVRKGSAFP
jgi:hypothetical protein